MKLPQQFYERPNVVQISRELLGKYLFTHLDGVLCGGAIVETEAYAGRVDKACHAHLNRRTRRTEVMFGPGGRAYVYLCYGIHALFNIVSNEPGEADAVLVRAIEPTVGLEAMCVRRKMAKVAYRLTAGPGVMSQALGIGTQHNQTDLQGDLIWIEDRGMVLGPEEIVASPRIGIGYAQEDALLPWRFRIQDNPWCSPAR